MDLVTLNLYQFDSFGQFPSKLRFYHQNLPGYLNISYVVSFWDTLVHNNKGLGLMYFAVFMKSHLQLLLYLLVDRHPTQFISFHYVLSEKRVHGLHGIEICFHFLCVFIYFSIFLLTFDDSGIFSFRAEIWAVNSCYRK